VLVFLNLAWAVADSLLSLGWIAVDRQRAIPYKEEEERSRLMFEWLKDAVVSRPAEAGPSQVAERLTLALAGKKVNVPMRYAVALLDGQLYVVEMPPGVLLHHCVLDSQGHAVVSDDETLVAAIWAQALRRRATVMASPGPPSVTQVTGHGLVNRNRGQSIGRVR
jgi:hypothetical protein